MLKKMLALVALIVLVPAVAFASPITTLVVIGDSLSDQGNAFLATGGAFPPAPYAQRASNGPVAVEVLAARLGIPLAPVMAGGTNYAFLGSATGPVTFPGTSTTTDNLSAVTYNQPALANTGLTNQMLMYLGTGPVPDPDGTLFVVWGGANDFFIDPSGATAANAVTNLASGVGALYGAGARRFLVPNMPDLSLTPYGLSLPPAQRAGLQQLSIGFNTGLSSAIGGLSLLPGIEVTPFDTFGLLTAISANPAAFGFATASAPCLAGSPGGVISVCADPDNYFFWDTVHPTAAAHRVIGDAFAEAVGVPEPAAVMLLGLGLAAAARRRRRS